jgi:kynurenine formamidase
MQRFFMVAPLIMVAALLFVLAAPGFAADPDAGSADWYPSRYGAGDTLGAINELSPSKVLEAVRLVKQGKTYALGVETGRDTPAFPPRSFDLNMVAAGDGSGATVGSNRATWNDDWMLTWLGIGTQIDGLAHFGIDHVYYNGHTLADIWDPKGAKKLGTHELPPIVTRGVVLDMAGLKGVPYLKEGVAIHRADLEAAAKRQGVSLAAADVVLLHTGWQRMAEQDPERFLAGMPGLAADGAEWLASLRVVAVGADTWGLDVLPSDPPELVFPAHQILLAKNGIYILENIRTDELVADRAWEFLFVLGQPRFVGAVQMVINPVAIR